jgi:GNAT superfamily N-acetyltransferase
VACIEVRPVCTARDRRRFLTFPWRIYRTDPLWVPPLLPEYARRIDPARGPFFRQGDADFFIAWRGREPVGTVCAAQDRDRQAVQGKRECIFGFLEYAEDFEVFSALLARATEWATQRGLEALYGPFNLDREDGYGVLVDGWDRPPALLCGHSRPYYREFMERFGFEPGRAQNLAYAIDVGQDTRARRHLARLAKRIRDRGGISIRGANLDDWDGEIDRVHRLLNRALAHLDDHIPWRRDALESLLRPFQDLADPDLILFAEVDGEAVGWFPGIPNLNEALIHANGLRYPWDYARLWWAMRRQPDCLSIKSVLVLPEYWNRGVAVLLFDEMDRRAAAKGYRWVDLSLTSADNPQTPILAERMGASVYKRYQVYRLAI